MNQSKLSLDLLFQNENIRHGQFGPITLAMRADTSEMVMAEQVEPIDLDTVHSLEPTVSRLMSSTSVIRNDSNIVPYLGFQQKGERFYLISEYSSGHTLYDFVQSQGFPGQSLAYSILGQILNGVEEFQQKGFTPSFLDAKNILIEHDGMIKLGLPYSALNTVGKPIPVVIATLPETGHGNMDKADAWLFGLIAAQLLSGNADIFASVSSQNGGAQARQHPGTTWESLLLPHINHLDKGTSDILLRCLKVDPKERPSVSELRAVFSEKDGLGRN